MDTLRAILIVLGIILVGGIYIVDYLKRHKVKKSPSGGEFDLDETGELHGLSNSDEEGADEWVGKAVTITANRHEQLADDDLAGLKGIGGKEQDELLTELEKVNPFTTAETKEEEPETVIVLTLMAGDGLTFSGPMILKVLLELGLQHGEMGIFHYFVGGGDTPLFSVANILEPGSFNLNEMETIETPGLALFMQLPAMLDGGKAMESLLHKSKQMAALLNGTLCDERRQPLDQPALDALHARVSVYSAHHLSSH